MTYENRAVLKRDSQGAVFKHLMGGYIESSYQRYTVNEEKSQNTGNSNDIIEERCSIQQWSGIGTGCQERAKFPSLGDI